MIDKNINPFIDHIRLLLKTLPQTPGVYQHIDITGTVIYVGKARNLKRRITSYFTRYDDHTPKIKMLVRSVCDIRITVTPTEVDALLLENNLIKQLKPRYNSTLKDDRSYPYLVLTDEDFPRMLFTHKRETVQGEYFGPYPNSRILHELQDLTHKLFPYRSCRLPLVDSRSKVHPYRHRPCINYQMGLCCAPCCNKVTYEEYDHIIQQLRRVLKGDFGDVLQEMKQQMFAHADKLEFEQAEALRRKIGLLEAYQSRSAVVGIHVKDVDVYSIVSDERTAYINMLRIKNGNIIHSGNTQLTKQLDESDAEMLAITIPHLHRRTESTAQEAIVPFPIPDLPKEYIKQTVPTRGDKLQLLELSQRNVRLHRHQYLQQKMLVDPDEHSRQLLERIQKTLQLPELPRNIECFDNSNISGAYPVAGMVRFTDGKPNKSEYRKFNIKTVEGPDDCASMAEVIRRRYKRLKEEGKEMPQLLIVDGGAGQMEMARRVLHDELKLNIPIAGLAKDDHHHTRELLYGFPPKAVGMKPADPLFHLLERIQNEVQRFAITHHRDKRSKGTFRTQLTDIPGIGHKTAQDLLIHFGSVKEVKIQPVESLAKVIGRIKAQLVVNFFNK